MSKLSLRHGFYTDRDKVGEVIWISPIAMVESLLYTQKEDMYMVDLLEVNYGRNNVSFVTK